jgi:putative Mg2+ transporter-C (MgtC) family protein
MTWIDFGLRLVIAFILGVGIGIERQWLKTRSVLKTNVLVTLGAAMFVMLSVMTPGDASPTRIAAQVVSGIGFLGGGVILREGASVRGINTAATLWCAGAIGSLVGAGFLVHAYFGTVAVVGANLLLRPIVQVFQKKIDDKLEPPKYSNEELRANVLAQTKQLESPDEEYDDEDESLIISCSSMAYQYRFWCHPQDESKVIAQLWESLKNCQNVNLTSIQRHQVSSEPPKVELAVNLLARETQDSFDLINSIASFSQFKVATNSFDWEFSCEKAQ